MKISLKRFLSYMMKQSDYDFMMKNHLSTDILQKSFSTFCLHSKKFHFQKKFLNPKKDPLFSLPNQKLYFKKN